MRRFLSMHPTSVFAYNPEIIQPKAPKAKDEDSDEEGKETLATLHARVQNQEVLCYLQLLETNKPYLLNVFRIHGLHGCLLFSRSGTYSL